MKQFKGVYTALVTPIRNNQIDEKALRNLVDWQIKSGISGLVPCGTTGESATLSVDERKNVIQIVIDQTKKRVPVIAGTGSNNTAETVSFTTWAKDAGAEAALVVTPYYNKPSQEGLFRHYEKVAKVDIPVVLYNVPGRTAVSLTPETIGRLSKLKNVVAVKEATASMDFATQVQMKCDADFTLLSGDDFTFLPFLSLGGDGVISVVSNVMPKEFCDLYKNFCSGNLEQAQSIHKKMYPLIQALFLESNPIPVKTALSLMKKIDLEFRLPLCTMREASQKKLSSILCSLELI